MCLGSPDKWVPESTGELGSLKNGKWVEQEVGDPAPAGLGHPPAAWPWANSLKKGGEDTCTINLQRLWGIPQNTWAAQCTTSHSLSRHPRPLPHNLAGTSQSEWGALPWLLHWVQACDLLWSREWGGSVLLWRLDLSYCYEKNMPRLVHRS